MKTKNKNKLIGIQFETIIFFIFIMGCTTSIPDKKTVEIGNTQDNYTEPAPLSTTATSVPMEMSVSMFKNVVAGDYSVLSLKANGSVELTGWNRLNQVTTHKKSKMGITQLSEIFEFFRSPEFLNLEQEYDLYPLPEDDQMVYEDIYYIFDVQIGERMKVVIAHEQVLPTQIKKIVLTLDDIAHQIDEVDDSGQFIFAGNHVVLGYKRLVSSPNLLVLNDADLLGYPILNEALAHPYSAVPIGNLEGTLLGEVLDTKKNSLEVHVGERYYDVLLLVRK